MISVGRRRCKSTSALIIVSETFREARRAYHSSHCHCVDAALLQFSLNVTLRFLFRLRTGNVER